MGEVAGGVYLITGISAAGKSSVAAELAQRLAPRSVHVRGDVFRRMVVNGRADMTADPSPEALQQLRLCYRLGAQVADGYAAAGFTTVLQDVILGADLAEMVGMISARPLRVVVLAPRPDVVAAREAARAKSGYDAVTIEALDRVLRDETPRLGWWIDSSAQSLDETVDEILRRAS